MKKFALLFLASAAYAQDPALAPEVTGIQVANILNDAVVLEWFSSLPAASPDDFIFYCNPSNAIANVQIQNDSRTVRPRNFQSSPRAGRTLYSAEVPILRAGEFYFAVAPSRGLSVDEAVRQNLPLSTVFIFQPEQNYTIQPVAFQLRKPAAVSGAVSNLGAPAPVLVKSLRLSSEEDIFRLTWMVSQNNLNRYTFRIYRSRYPLADIFKGRNTRTLETLPVYAVVDNKFYFEDRNISFETPYYYAVVAEGSAQWDSGLNIFSTPAVLVRQSPPFTISPQQEAVKQKLPFTVQQSTSMTEADIEQAVRQTLSNLMYAPAYTNADTLPPAPIINPEPLNPQDFINIPESLLPAPNAPAQAISYRSSLAGNLLQTESSALTGLFYQGAAARYLLLVQAENKAQNDMLASLQAREKQFLSGIQTLKNDIFAYRQSAALLAQSSRLNSSQGSKLAADFLKKRDQIFLKEFTLKNNRQTILSKKISEKESLQTNLESLQQKYLQSISRLKEQYKDSLTALAQKISRKNEEIQRQNEKNARVENLTRLVQAPNSEAAQLVPLYTLPQIDLPDLAKLDSPSFYSLPVLSPPSVRLQNIDFPITNEPIPSLSQLEEASNQKEGWLKAKTEWLSANMQSWKENIQAWHQTVPSLFTNTEDYRRLQGTWDLPSMPLSSQTAYSKGKEAFDGAKYNEAAYFLVRIPENDNALMMLGQSFYRLGQYKEAVTVFASAYQMNLPGALPWLLEAAQKYTEEPSQKP